MSTLGLNTVSREQPSTEWDDIQRRLGNLPPLQEPSPLDGPSSTAAATAASGTSNRSREEATTAGTVDEDEKEELARLRAARLDELKGTRGARPPRFGNVERLERADYTKEVNEAGEGVGVVVFLCKSKGHYLSSYTLVLLEQLARKFGDVKCLQIESTECIPGYPDSNLPTLLLYRDDDLLRQCTGPSAFGGSSFGIDSVEWELAQAGLVSTELKKCPHANSTAMKPEC